MHWIKISDKIPSANKPYFGLEMTSYNELRPVVFCRRATKINPIYQDWYDLRTNLKIVYWMEIEYPNI